MKGTVELEGENILERFFSKDAVLQDLVRVKNDRFLDALLSSLNLFSRRLKLCSYCHLEINVSKRVQEDGFLYSDFTVCISARENTW